MTMHALWSTPLIVLLGCAQSAVVPAAHAPMVYVQVKALPADARDWQVLAPGDALHSGDRFAVEIQVEQPVFPYAASRAPGRPLALLYPVAQQTQVRAAPGHLMHMPGEGQYFRLDDRTGPEQLFVVLTVQSLAATSLAVQEVIDAAAARNAIVERDPPPKATDRNRGEPDRRPLSAVINEIGATVLRCSFQHL